MRRLKRPQSTADPEATPVGYGSLSRRRSQNLRSHILRGNSQPRIDFLNTVWERAYNRPLLRLRSVEKTAALSLGCTTQNEFRARLQDLNELFKLMDIPDELLPESDRPIDKRQTFTRMVACLEARITDEAERERLRASVDGLRAVNTVRNKLTHGGGSELVAAMCIFESNIRYRTMGKAWNAVRAKIAEALATIRSALQAAL
jgi:hypothetical protein